MLKSFVTDYAETLRLFRQSVTQAVKSSQPLPFAPRNEPPPIAYTLSADGRLQAVKASTGNYGSTAFGAYSNADINSTPVGYAMAYIASVWANRCVDIRAKAVSRMDWNVYDRATNKVIPNHPFTVALQRSPTRVIRKLEWSQQIWGETFLRPHKNNYNYYSDITWLNNLGMSVITGAGYIMSFDYSPVQGGRPQIFKPRELAYIKTDNPFDDLRGLSKFESVLIEVGIDRDIARAAKAYYTNDMRIGLMLIPENDVPPAQAKEFMDWMKVNFQGAKNAGKPVLMPKAIKEIKEIQGRPVESDVENRESVRREICAAFGVPLSVAGAWDDATYQSAPEQRRSFYEETIIPECEDLADDMTQKVLPFFDDSGKAFLRADSSRIMALMDNQLEKAQVASTQLASSGITLNEYRAKVGQASLPNGNAILVPAGAQFVPVEDIGKLPPPAPAQPNPFAAVAPKSLPAPETVTLPAEAVSKQDTPDEELQTWRKFALRNGARKAQRFVCYRMDADNVTRIKAALSDIPDPDDKDAIKQVFDGEIKAEPPIVLTPDGFAELVGIWSDIGLNRLVEQVTNVDTQGDNAATPTTGA
jgi:HK97 family phage portal protein